MFEFKLLEKIERRLSVGVDAKSIYREVVVGSYQKKKKINDALLLPSVIV